MMNVEQFQQKIQADLFLHYDPRATEQRIREGIITLSEKFDKEERAFLGWLSYHVQLIHDFNHAISFITQVYTYTTFRNDFLTLESNWALAKMLYDHFYSGFKFQNLTALDILAAHGFDKIRYYRYTKDIAADVTARVGRINAANQFELVKTEQQTPDFFYIMIIPPARENYEKFRFYLTVNPLRLRECVIYLLETLISYAASNRFEIHFKFATVPEYRKDALIIYADRGISDSIKALSDDWFLDYTIPYGSKIAKGRTLVKDVGRNIVERLLRDINIEASNGTALSRLFADSMITFVKRHGKLPENDKEKMEIILNVCYKLFSHKITVQDGVL